MDRNGCDSLKPCKSNDLDLQKFPRDPSPSHEWMTPYYPVSEKNMASWEVHEVFMGI